VAARLKAKLVRPCGRATHDYLLSGRIFCGCCGYRLTGQPVVGNRGEPREWVYYRHQSRYGGAACPLKPRPMVPAAQLEAAVLTQLLTLFFNPEHLRRACRAAVPDCDKLLKRKARLESALAKAAAARERVLALVARGAATLDEAEGQLGKVKEEESSLRQELDGITAQLAHLPQEGAEQSLAAFAEAWRRAHCQGLLLHCGYPVSDPAAGLSLEDRRRILGAVFDGALPDGTAPGVYVSPAEGGKAHRPKSWGFVIRGRLSFEVVGGPQSVEAKRGGEFVPPGLRR
jgi:hypothetical protein